MNKAARWIFENDQLSIQDDTGSKVLPTALQVYTAVFSEVNELDGYQFDSPPSVTFPSLIFSKFPADPTILIRGVTPGSITVKVGVWTDKGYCDIATDCDQVICDGKWYPVSHDAISAAQAWLTERGVFEDSSISFGTLIELRSAKDSPVKIIDESVVVASDVAVAAGRTLGEIQGLNATLYPYQVEGVGFLTLIAQQEIGCILADEMGLGKTLQVIALLQTECNRGCTPSLIVAPATIVENWRREIALFAPALNVHIHAGPARAGIAERLTPYDVVVTSFDTVIRDEPLLGAVNWNLLVLDEAQAIKNPDAQRTKAVKRLPRRVSLAVTGTPVENRLDDLWSLSDFALPGLLGSVSEFRASFTDDLTDASRLGPVVSPILLRRRVRDVAQDLPEKIEVPQAIVIGTAMAEAYEDIRLSTQAEYGPAAGMVATGRLRMFCADPRLVSNSLSDVSIEASKYARLLELLSEIFESNQKVLVFTSYQGMSDIFMQDIPSRWPAGFFRFIDGRVPVTERQPTVDQFYEFTGYGALFLNPKAAGAGLNITAANHVIHYNPEWNPALTDQASARAFRRKQKLPVTIHHLYYADTIEEVILARAQFKRGLADEAVVGHDGDVDPYIIVRALQISPLSKFQEDEK